MTLDVAAKIIEIQKKALMFIANSEGRTPAELEIIDLAITALRLSEDLERKST